MHVYVCKLYYININKRCLNRLHTPPFRVRSDKPTFPPGGQQRMRPRKWSMKQTKRRRHGLFEELALVFCVGTHGRLG